MLAITQDNFDHVIDEHEIVFIDFWAQWCQPCIAFSDIFERVASDYPQICFSKLNIEEQPFYKEFGIQSIPTLMVIKKKVVIYSESGNMPEGVLRDLVDQAIATSVES